MGLQFIDYLVLGAYAVTLVAIAFWVSREKKGHVKDTSDYFLAGKSLPWWAIGASLIAANISAEQVIGMSGSGFAIGLGIASYEWMAALTLILVGKFFLPIFLEHRIYTMPQFLEQRYDGTVRTVMAVFWLGVYVLVNLTSIMWLGALAIHTLTGLDQFWGLVALAAFAAAYSIYGGLKAVALTDIIQVAMLVAGGLLISYLSLNALSNGHGPIAGFEVMLQRAPEKFDMVLAQNHPFHKDLPGLSVLLGGMWIMNLSYWGFNQYIIQRALGAKDVREAQAGIMFAAFLKLLVPVLVVIPGIAAFLLQPNVACVMPPDAAQQALTFVPATSDVAAHCVSSSGAVVQDALIRYDRAYPAMMALAPAGLRGLIFAALVAAIVSSLGSMMNSIATIFTMDLYRSVAPKTPENTLVWIGRGVALGAIVLAVFVAEPLLGKADQVFQWLQEFTGFFTPGIVALFGLGMFWKRTTPLAGLCGAIGSALFSLIFKLDLTHYAGLAWRLDQIPFMNRVGYVFLWCVATMVVVSLLQGAKVQEKAVHPEKISFATSARYNIGAAVIAAILIGLYAVFW
jgi:solute:Na+ symporter, SSS family